MPNFEAVFARGGDKGKKEAQAQEAEEKRRENFRRFALAMSDGEAEDYYQRILAAFMILNPEIARQIDARLDARMAEEEISIQEACVLLKEAELARMNIDQSGHSMIVGRRAKEKFPDDPNLRQVFSSMADSERFLGNGSVAEVYRFVGYEGVCVKVVTDFQRYAEGNRVYKEGWFLDKLEDLEVEGVRTPWLYYAFELGADKIIVMEELPAANCRRVLDGLDALPPSFDPERYFTALEAYLRALHEKGIYHRDFVLRNLMINRESGLPMVIDFGKAESRDDIVGTRNYEDKIEINVGKDWAGLESAKAEMLAYLEKIGLDKGNK